MTLLRLSPMPDEFAIGYQGRLFRHNGWTDARLGLRALLAWAGSENATRGKISTVELLAQVAGKELGRFVCDHTLVPLARAVTTTAPGIPHGREARTSLLATVGLRRFRPGAFFCVECIKEDYAFHGMPYWRREHQLPGRYWCLKHGCALGHASARDAYLRSPTDFIATHQVVSEPWLHELKQSQPIKRFLAICSELLASQHPFDELYVAKTARSRAAELGLHTGRGAIRRPLLSGYVKRNFDSVWLNAIVPGLVDCPAGTYWVPVDAAAFGKRAGVSAIAYAIVFASLYESADAAIGAMLASPSVEAPDRVAHARSIKVDDARLRAAYVEAQGSHITAATQVNVGRDRVSRRLKALGLPALRGEGAIAIQNVIAGALREDLNFEKACIAHGFSQATMRNILRAALTPLTQALGKILPLTPPSAGTPRRSRSRSPLPPPMHRAEQATLPTGKSDSPVTPRSKPHPCAVRTAA